MRRKRPIYRPRSRRKQAATTPRARTPQFRRPSPLDEVPNDGDTSFKVLGTAVDRYALVGFAEPMEMLVIHGFTREVEDAFKKYRGRVDDFWRDQPEMVEKAQKLDEVLASIAERG